MSRQPRVLVVDDDLDSLYYVDDLLHELGYYPIKATTADDAAEIIGAMYLDAMIIDFDMIATASEAALNQFSAARDVSSVLIMAKQDVRPEGELSPLRCFVEHPPLVDELAQALETCAVAAVRAER